MMCHIVYTGRMIPIFNWTKSNTKGVIAANTNIIENSNVPFTTIFSLSVQLHYDDNGVIFKCKITFQLPNNSQGIAPEFEYMWNHTAKVLFKYTSKSPYFYATKENGHTHTGFHIGPISD